MAILGIFSSKKSLADSGVLKGTTDRHSHILYGVDDGIKTAEDALDAIAFEESLGVTDIWCTPHVMEDMPNTTEALKARFGQLCTMYSGPVRLHLAAEYMVDPLFEQRLKDRDLLTMEDNTLLVETSTIAPPYDLEGSLKDIMSAGYRPMFAHPERCRFLDVKDIVRLHEMGVRLQLNLASLTGYYGTSAKEKALQLLKTGLYSAYGSDCHRVRNIQDQYSRKELTKETIHQLSVI